MNHDEKRVIKAIDSDALVKTTSELIAIPSVTGDEADAQRFISKIMSDFGLATDIWEIDIAEARKHPDFSMGVDRKQGLGVVGRYGGKRGRRLILNGHIDVVSPGNVSNWSYPPWCGTLVGGELYGRGTVDMKGGLCCALYAVKSVIDSGVDLSGQVFLESVVGEEDGGLGALDTVLRGYKADGAVIVEPTELKIAPAQAGSHCFRIKVRGKSAHACVREEGVSALEKFIPIYNALMALEERRNRGVKDPLYSRYRLPAPLNLGIVNCGTWPSSVPEELILEGRYGIGVDESVTSAHNEFENAIEKAASSDEWLRDHPPKLEWRGGQFNPARTPIDQTIVRVLSEASKAATGVTPTYEGVTYGSDMRHLVNIGRTPTILFGPGDVRLSHRPDEHVCVRDLVTATKTLALTILRFCQ